MQTFTVEDIYRHISDIDESLSLVWDDINTHTSHILTIQNHFSVYNKHTKSYLNRLSETIHSRRDYTSAMVKKSKKADLPATLINVLEQLIDSHNNHINSLNELKSSLKNTLELQKKIIQGRLLFESISYKREQYIDSFETANEGERAWRVLEIRVCNGTVGINDLESYGIEPPVIL